jgi:hypothetical protein
MNSRRIAPPPLKPCGGLTGGVFPAPAEKPGALPLMLHHQNHHPALAVGISGEHLPAPPPPPADVIVEKTEFEPVYH